jgi:hypothetical protein
MKYLERHNHLVQPWLIVLQRTARREHHNSAALQVLLDIVVDLHMQAALGSLAVEGLEVDIHQTLQLEVQKKILRLVVVHWLRHQNHTPGLHTVFFSFPLSVLELAPLLAAAKDHHSQADRRWGIDRPLWVGCLYFNGAYEEDTTLDLEAVSARENYQRQSVAQAHQFVEERNVGAT